VFDEVLRRTFEEQKNGKQDLQQRKGGLKVGRDKLRLWGYQLRPAILIHPTCYSAVVVVTM